MAGFKSLIRRHQIVAFFTLTLGMNFVLGIPGIALLSAGQSFLRIIGFYLLRVAVFSPVMSGVFVARLSDMQSKGNKRTARWITFCVVGVLAWIIGTLQMKSTMPAEGGMSLTRIMLLNGPLALLPAFVFSRASSRNLSVRKYLTTLVRPRGNIVWYVIAFFTFPVIHILGNLITHLLGGQPFQTQGYSLNLVWIAVITFLSVFFFTGGINEESGWRGFALPGLQERLSPILAGLIIWVGHTIWELNGDVLMSFFMSGHASWPAISRLVWMPCWTILFIWVYNRTGGSILAPAIFHSSMNMMNPLMVVLPTTAAGTVLLVLLAVFAVAYDQMWRKVPINSSAVVRLHVNDRT